MRLLAHSMMVTSAFLLLCACNATIGDERAPAGSKQKNAGVASLPTTIATVRTVGWWTEGEREGTYRIIVEERGFDKIVSKLFIQWLEVVEGAPETGTLATVGIEQLNELPAYKLEIAAVHELQDRLDIELDGYNHYTGETERFLIRAGPPSDVSLEERS